MMEPAPSAQIVGQEFVKQYYTMLNAAPEHLHRFYSNNSNFVHGSMDGRPDEQQTVTGQAEIHKKIMSLNFSNCHARICQVDCQSSVAGSVVVQVIGELSNNGQPMRKFVQSFVLAPQSAKKYYVHIDIFRYQDIYPLTTEPQSDQQPHDHSVEELELKDAAAAAGIQVITTDNAEETQHSTEITEQPTQDSAATDGTNGELAGEMMPAQESADAETDAAAAGDGDEQRDDVVKATTEMTATQDDNNTTTADDNMALDGDLAGEQPERNDQTAEEETHAAPAKPLTWAAMASRNAAGSSTVLSSASNTGSAPRQQTLSDTKATTEVNQTPKTAWSPSGSDDRNVNGGGGGVMVNGANKDDTPRLSTSAINYPDNQQVFVGNLPQHLADHDLIEFFEQFGKVLDFRINRKTGTPQAGNNVGQKNFGFMVFESPDTVQKVLAERPIFLRKLRLNIEEKKPRDQLAAARLSSLRGGGASRRGGYGRGVDIRTNLTDKTRTY